MLLSSPLVFSLAPQLAPGGDDREWKELGEARRKEKEGQTEGRLSV